MTARALRFRPPSRRLEAGQGWAICRAFWPVTSEPFVVDAEEALEAVEALRLGRRIASRVPPAILVAELEREGAEWLRRERRAAVARGLQLRQALAEVLGVASRVGLSPVLLKLAALEAHGVLEDGSRAASDVDILLDEEEARMLRRQLLAEGWEAGGEREEEHHLAAVCRPGGVPIEIHTRLPGVRLGRSSVAAGGLARAGLLADGEGELVGARVPSREVLVAHLLVHGLAQHGASPRAYPMLQPFADVIDLGWPGDAATLAGTEADVDERIRVSVETIAPWVEQSLGRSRLEAAARLCARLAGGDPSLFDESMDTCGEAALLHHCVWGMADPAYAESLRLEALAPGVSDLPPWRARARGVLRALLPSKGELARIYGGDPSPLRLAWLRVYRPFDLVGRAARTMWRRAQIRG